MVIHCQGSQRFLTIQLRREWRWFRVKRGKREKDMVSFRIHQHQLHYENHQNCAGKKYTPTIDLSRHRGWGNWCTLWWCWWGEKEWVLMCWRGSGEWSNWRRGASSGNSHGRWLSMVRRFVFLRSCGQKSFSKVGNLHGFQGASNWLFAGFGLEKLNQVQFQMSSGRPNSSSNWTMSS